jgi:hypothetical protein
VIYTSTKGQAITYDFFMAMAIFFIILVIVFSYWAYSLKEIEETRAKEEAFDSLLKASQVWFKEGYPVYWSNETVVEIGLANDRKINRTKVELLNDLGYQKFLSLMNLGMFNVFYNVTNETSVVLEFGNPPISANNIYRIERVGVLDNQAVKVETIIWT